MIVVTTPTGKIGRHVVADLIARNEALRLVVRDPKKLPHDLLDRADIVEGSHGDREIITRALAGADALFWVAPPNPRKTLDEAYVDFAGPAVEAIRACRLARVVSVTALGRGTRWQDKAGLVTASLRMDDILMATGVSFRGLAMPTFMDALLGQVESIRSGGLITWPVDGDRKTPFTAACDIGAAAARLLADADWSRQAEMPLIGPEDLSMNEMAAMISEVIGREVRYERMSWEVFSERLTASGMSPSFVNGYVAMMRAKDEGMDVEAARDVSQRTRTSFRRWCENELQPVLQY
jgi:uncharacterized protein YbjT (DUF2867 family)